MKDPNTQMIEINPIHKNHALIGIKNKIDVVMEIKTKKTVTQEREGFHLILLLDVSGSMEGEKLENSKQVIKNIINTLYSKDTLSFVTYSTYAEVIFTHGNSSNKKNFFDKFKRSNQMG